MYPVTMVFVTLHLLFIEHILRTIKLFRAYQNDAINNFAVVASAIIKRVDFIRMVRVVSSVA